MKKNKLVLTLSGGMDSSILLYMAVRAGYNDIYTLSFDYGQRHIRELSCVRKQIENCGNIYPNVRISEKVIDVNYINSIAPTSSLTNESIDNPNINEMAGDAQPASYVPFRNLMFLSICCSYAEGVGADKVWYGAAQVDSLAGYWDGSEEFVSKLNEITALNRDHRITVEAPLLTMSKAEIVKYGIEAGVNFADTWTCYSNRKDGLADATTPSSSLRIKGFIDAGYKDPIKYVQQDKIEEMYKKNNCTDY